MALEEGRTEAEIKQGCNSVIINNMFNCKLTCLHHLFDCWYFSTFYNSLVVYFFQLISVQEIPSWVVER